MVASIFICPCVYTSINKKSEKKVSGTVAFVENINPCADMYGKRRRMLSSTNITKIMCLALNCIPRRFAPEIDFHAIDILFFLGKKNTSQK